MKSLGTAIAVLSMAVVLAASGQPACAQSGVDGGLPPYRPQEEVSGKLTLNGSNTLSQIATIWADGFRQYHPKAELDINVKGAVASVNSVIEGEADVGLLSRSITREEIKAFVDKFGYEPTVLTPTYETIAVYVHADNPVQGLTLEQLDAIYSTTLHRGAEKTAMTWGDVGVTGRWAKQPIVCLGRNASTGSQVYFQEMALRGGTFRKDMKPHGDNLELVHSVSETPGAIGFAGTSYELAGVRMVPLSLENGRPYVSASAPDAARGQYPLIRPLQFVINQPPDSKIPAIEGEFIKYVFSRFGQQDVVRAGMRPVMPRRAQTALDTVGLGTAK